MSQYSLIMEMNPRKCWEIFEMNKKTPKYGRFQGWVFDIYLNKSSLSICALGAGFGADHAINKISKLVAIFLVF